MSRHHPRSPWTPERIALLHRDFPANVLSSTIRAGLNALPGPSISGPAMRNKVKRDGLERSPGFVRGGKLMPHHWDEIVARADAGEIYIAIAAVYGITPSGVTKIVRRAGRAPKKRGRTRKANAPRPYAVKWTEERIAQLREMRQAGASPEEIGVVLCCTPGAAMAIVKRFHIHMTRVPVEKKPPVKRAPRVKAAPKPKPVKKAATRPAILRDVTKPVSVNKDILAGNATPVGPPPYDRTWAEIAVIAKQIGCWRATQDFLLVDVNARLVALGKRPVRIRKWEKGAIPGRDLRLDAFA